MLSVTPPYCIHYVISVQRHDYILPVISGESGCFIWILPQSLTEGTCDLDIKGEDGRGEYTFSEKREIQVVDSHQVTFVQTDKPVYKPKDKGIV